jgi:hypothetical protein
LVVIQVYGCGAFGETCLLAIIIVPALEDIRRVTAGLAC